MYFSFAISKFRVNIFNYNDVNCMARTFSLDKKLYEYPAEEHSEIHAKYLIMIAKSQCNISISTCSSRTGTSSNQHDRLQWRQRLEDGRAG